jgi:hypothetical protein
VNRDSKKVRNRWARLSVGYYRDPKVLEVGPVGELAFLRLLALARETVEDAAVDGAVPLVLAARELREVTDLYVRDNPGAGFTELIGALSDVGLVVLEGKSVIVKGYAEWQTTRSEIDTVREETRRRVADHRARKAAAKNAGGNSNDEDPGGEDDMGVYDTSVEAFTDLRDAGEVKKGTRKVGKHGLSPAQVADAERVVEHLTTVRKELLGTAGRVTPTWWTDVKKLLNGSGDSPALTADQACDLIDFALQHKFWHAHCQTPTGLAKHGGKLYSSDEYVTWSKRNDRPRANRPRDNAIGQAAVAPTRGQLAADRKVDWSKVSEEL